MAAGGAAAVRAGAGRHPGGGRHRDPVPGSQRPLGNALAFAAAFSLVYAGLSAVVLVMAQASDEPLVDPRAKSRITLAIGLLLLVMALIGWLRGAAGRPTGRGGWTWLTPPGRPRPWSWGGHRRAQPNTPILLGGLSAISAADVSPAEQSWGWPSCWPAPGRPDRSDPVVRRPARRRPRPWPVQGLADRHERLVDLGVLAGFGALFTLKGLTTTSTSPTAPRTATTCPGTWPTRRCASSGTPSSPSRTSPGTCGSTRAPTTPPTTPPRSTSPGTRGCSTTATRPTGSGSCPG